MHETSMNQHEHTGNYIPDEISTPENTAFQPADGYTMASETTEITVATGSAVDAVPVPYVFGAIEGYGAQETGPDTETKGDIPVEAQSKVRVELSLPEGPPTLAPRYDYAGAVVKEHPEVIAPIDTYLRTKELQNTAEEVADHSYNDRLYAAQHVIANLGERLGVDLSDRVVDSDHFHFYDPKQYRVARGGFTDATESNASQYADLNEGQSVAVNTASGHVLVSVAENSDKGTLGNGNHELIHVLSYKQLGVEVEETDTGHMISPVPLRMGYSNERTGAFNGLTEALTEITNIDLMKNDWPQDEALAPLTDDEYTELGYIGELILVDDILKTRFDDPKAALAVLQQGMLTGNVRNLNILHDAVGTQGMKEIASMSNTIEELAQSAEALGMPDTARKIRENDRTGLLDWL